MLARWFLQRSPMWKNKAKVWKTLLVHFLWQLNMWHDDIFVIKLCFAMSWCRPTGKEAISIWSTFKISIKRENMLTLGFSFLLVWAQELRNSELYLSSWGREDSEIIHYYSACNCFQSILLIFCHYIELFLV